MKKYKPLTPEEIVEYMHDEGTPYSRMDFEEGKQHIKQLINLYVKWAIENQEIALISLKEDSQTNIA